jgi:hypothetical protein
LGDSIGQHGAHVFDEGRQLNNHQPFVQMVDVNYLDRSATTILAGGSGE